MRTAAGDASVRDAVSAAVMMAVIFMVARCGRGRNTEKSSWKQR